MSSVNTSALGMGGSDSGGSIAQPMVEREIIPIGESSDDSSSSNRRPRVDNGSSSDDNAPSLRAAGCLGPPRRPLLHP